MYGAQDRTSCGPWTLGLKFRTYDHGYDEGPGAGREDIRLGRGLGEETVQ